jgi:hypothetical protein
MEQIRSTNEQIGNADDQEVSVVEKPLGIPGEQEYPACNDDGE